MGRGMSTSVNAIDSFSESLDRLHAALDASCVVGTWDWDIVRGVVVYDAGAARLLAGDASLAEQEIGREQSVAAVHPADHAWLLEHVNQELRAGGLLLAEFRVIAQDGTVHWLLSRGRTYQDPVGHPVRTRGIIIDITEMREGGERYVVRDPLPGDDPLDQAAALALTLKQTLSPDVPSDVHTATDLLLFALGRAIARASGGH